MTERSAARVFIVAYPVAVALGLSFHPEPPAIEGFLALPLLWPMAVFFRRFTLSPTGVAIETEEVRSDLTTAVAAVNNDTRTLHMIKEPTALPLSGDARTAASVGTSTSIFEADDVGPPFVDRSFLVASDDGALQLAALRIAIERELQAVAALAHLEGASAQRPLSIRALISELLRSELLLSDLAIPLNRVIDVANRAIHGASVEADTASVVASLGPKLVDGLRRLPLSPRWLTTLVRVRSGGQPWQILEKQLPSDVAVSIKIPDVQIEISPSLVSASGLRDDVVRFVGTVPLSSALRESLRLQRPLAWIKGRRILGTRSDKVMAPWLIDAVARPGPPVQAA